MKKTFSTQSPNKKPARQVDAIKNEIKKYIARERRKDLPENADFWDFHCKIGLDVESAKDIHLSEINSMIDQIISDGRTEFYLEVLAQPRKRQSKEK